MLDVILLDGAHLTRSGQRIEILPAAKHWLIHRAEVCSSREADSCA